MPGVCIYKEDWEAALVNLPQAHTCDNVLELPNYWHALVKVQHPEINLDADALALNNTHTDEDTVADSIQTELDDLVYARIRTAVEFTVGYELDVASMAVGDDYDDY